jgi:pyocin large subunit-like protein
VSNRRQIPKRRQIAAVITLLLALFGTFNSVLAGKTSSNKSTVRSTSVSTQESDGSGRVTRPGTVPETSSNRTDPRLRKIGFRSYEKLRSHYLKHGREFGNITQEQYLAMAQDIRDAPLSKTIIEATQVGGTISRFDRASGGFIAFNNDLTLRTFFRPDDGEAYFRRAAKRAR